MLALAQFVERDGKPVPGAARLEFLAYRAGKWQMSALEDPESNVFHKALAYAAAAGPRLLSLGRQRRDREALGEDARRAWSATTIWRKDFGGKFSRMRDAEVGDLYGDGRATIAVATHDQGVVAVLRPKPDGSFEVVELDHEKDTFVHEIEIGDLDGDHVLEVYATPSEPNRLDDRPQKGVVVRYVPNEGRGPSGGRRSGQAPREGDPGRRRRWGRPRRALRLGRGRSRRRGRQAARRPGRDPPLRRRHARPIRAS